MKKIAFLIDNMEIKGGSQRIVVNLSENLSNKYKVYFLTWYKDRFSYPLNENIEKISLLNERHRLRYDFIFIFNKLREFLQQKNIDIIIVVGRYAVVPILFLRFCLKSKVIFWEQNSMDGYAIFYNTLKRKILNWFILFEYKYFSNLIIFLTKKDESIYKELFLHSITTKQIYNYVDGNLFNETSNKKYDIYSKKIITVGRIAYQKGYEYLIEVAKLIFAKYPDWQWHIYGDGEENYKNQIIDLINQNNLQNNIILQGNRSDIYDLYQNYSFYVMTSRYEGLPMVLLEAKAKKLPIVSFNINSGPSDIVRDGIDGSLVKPFDCNSMADRISELIENPELRQNFSDNAHGNIDKFSKEKIIKQWCDLIDSI